MFLCMCLQVFVQHPPLLRVSDVGPDGCLDLKDYLRAFGWVFVVKVILEVCIRVSSICGVPPGERKGLDQWIGCSMTM